MNTSHKIHLGMIVGRGRVDETLRCLASLDADIDSAVISFSGWEGGDVAEQARKFYDTVTGNIPKLADKITVIVGSPILKHYAYERSMTLVLKDDIENWWYLWADSDDMLFNPGILRQAVSEAAEKGVNVVETKYILDGNKEGMIRERLVRMSLFVDGKARWKNALHEYIDIDEDERKAVRNDDILWHHMPDNNTRQASRERNKRILAEQLEGTDLNLFHLAIEFVIDGDIDLFRKYAHRALDFPSLGDNYRYHLLRLLGERADNVTDARYYYGHAIAVCPQYREAYADLIETEIRRAKPNKIAIQSLAAAMAAHKPISVNPYRDSSLYGWRGLDVMERVSRYCDGINAYHQRRVDAAQGRVQILLAHATYNRPHKCIQTRAKWLNFATHPERVIHVFGIEETDTDTEVTTRGMARVIVNQRANVPAFNGACEHPEAKDCQILLQLSDDTDCFPGWDVALEERLDVSKPQVLRTSDGCRDDWLMSMPVLTRKRYEQQGGWMLHPSYKGMYSDTDFSVRAMYDGVIVDARDLVFQHLHPMFGHGVADHTYAHNNDMERYRTGFETFQKLCGGMCEKLRISVPNPADQFNTK
jgi:hypothetical protein